MRPDFVLILGMVLIFLTAIAVIFVTNADIGYKINILDNSFPRGTDIELFYEIRNDRFIGNVNDVTFNYYIDSIQYENNVSYGSINFQQTISNKVTLSTKNLSKGEHKIITRLDYTIDTKDYSKYLTLTISLY